METIEYTDTLRQGTDKINANFNALETVSVSAAASLSASALGKVHLISGTSSNYTVDLPTAVGNDGKTIMLKAINSFTKIATIAGVSGQTIDGYANIKLAKGGLLLLVSDNSNWIILQEVGSWISFNPVWSGFSADPGIANCQYFKLGKLCIYKIKFLTSGTSNASATTVTAPFNAANIGVQTGLIQMLSNSGTPSTTAGVCNTRVSSNVLDLYKDAAAGAFAASNGKGATIELIYQIE